MSSGFNRQPGSDRNQSNRPNQPRRHTAGYESEIPGLFSINQPLQMPDTFSPANYNASHPTKDIDGLPADTQSSLSDLSGGTSMTYPAHQAHMASTSQPNKTKAELENRVAELKEQLMRQRRALSDRELTPRASGLAVLRSEGETGRPESVNDGFIPHSVPQEIVQPQVVANDNDIAALIADISGIPLHPSAMASGAPAVPTATMGTETPPPRGVGSGGAANGSHVANCSTDMPAKGGDNNFGNGMHQSGEVTDKTTAQAQATLAQVPPSTTTRQETPSSPGAAGPRSHLEEGEVSCSPEIDVNNKTSQPHVAATVSEPQQASVASYKMDAEKKATQGTGEATNRKTRQPEGVASVTGDARPPINPDDKDLKDWLIFTNYYDVGHRTQFLARRRRLADLEAERMRLLEEEEAATSFRRQFTPSSSTTAAFPRASAESGQPGTAPASAAPLRTTTATPVTPVTPVAPAPAPASTTAPPASVMATTPIPKQEDVARPVNHAKRNREDDDRDDHTVKHPRVDEDKADTRPRSAASSERPRQYYQSYHQQPSSYGAGYRDPSPPRPSRQDSPRRYDDYTQRAPVRRWSPGPRGPESHGSPERRYDSYRADRERELSPAPPIRRPYRSTKSLELGRKGDSRFFLVKSFNEANVRKCMEDGLWTTQLQNGEILTRAFSTCRNVILFFSVNKSRAFQGYARMLTAPSPSIPRPAWMKNIHWETTAPFRVEFYNTVQTGFQYVHHLHNSLNEELPVIIGKDGQEIEENCARELVKEMDNTAELEMEHERSRMDRGDYRAPPPTGPGASRSFSQPFGRGGRYVPRGGGSFSKPYIKKEQMR